MHSSFTTQRFRLLNLLALLLAVCCITTDSAAQETIRLWPNGAPTDNDLSGPESTDRCIGNISEPTLSLFHPAAGASNGGAVVVMPGGGYSVVCMEHEGIAVAEWLTGIGFTVGVLKYRMPNGHYQVPIQDAQQAVRIVRHRASEWGVDPNKIGVLGFSAGGHLASTVGTHFDHDYSEGKGTLLDVSHRPDFLVLVYPVVTMDNKYTHQGSRRNLLGENPAPVAIERFSNHLQVTDRTPPSFLVHSSDDTAVHPFNSTRFYAALLDNGVSAEHHLFEKGGHGYGLSPDSPSHNWKMLAQDWIFRVVNEAE